MKTVLKHCVFLLPLTAAPLAAAEFSPKARAFLNQNCAQCHDADVQKGGLRVDGLAVRGIGPDQRELLVRLFDRVHAGEMPPKKADQPTPAARGAFLGELENALESFDVIGGQRARYRSIGDSAAGLTAAVEALN